MVVPPARTLGPVVVLGSIAMAALNAVLWIGSDPLWPLIVGLSVALLAFPAMGALVVWRKPDNRVGWLFLGLGPAFLGVWLAWGYAGRGLSGGAALAGADVALWLSSWSWMAFTGMLIALVLVFPTGRPLSPRWRFVLAAALLVNLALTLGAAFGKPLLHLDAATAVANPFLLAAPLGPALAAIGEAAGLLLNLSPPLLVMGLFARSRRSRGVERQQLKWFAYAATVSATLLTSSFLIPPPLGDAAWAGAMFGFGAGLPIASGMAILRHRLYDIDRVISRTASYAVVTIVLGAVFGGTVLLLQWLLAPLTGEDTLAVAASTLVVFALFQPLRQHVQRAADRRFDRARYDAEQATDILAGRLRAAVDLELIRGEVSDTVRETVRPATAILWIRGSG